MNSKASISITFLLALVSVCPSFGLEPFEKKFSLQGITFNVSSPNTETGNTVRINPHGLKKDNTAVEVRVRGRVSGARVADLNQDGSPEIYVICKQDNDKSNIVGFASNRNRSLSQITVSDISDLDGYVGNDEIAIEGQYLTRTFRPKHDNGNFGNKRKLFFALKPGENSWMLVRDDGKGIPNAANNPKPNKPMEIRPRPNGQLEVLMPAGGILLYDRAGNLIQKGSTVSSSELREANKAVRVYRREQGL